jgi:transposase
MGSSSTKPDQHRCEWREAYEGVAPTIEELQRKLAVLAAQYEELKRLHFGKKSERSKPSKLPPAVPPLKATPKELRAKRAEAREERRGAMTTVDEGVVPLACTECPSCNGPLSPAGQSEPSETIEYVAGHFRRRITRCQTKSCKCGYIEQAKGPVRLGGRGSYAPSFAAHIVVAKCADAIPIHRIEKQLARQGVPVARSTMTDIFLRASELLKPVYDAMVAAVPGASVVHADESPFRQQDKDGRVYFWTFATWESTVYSYAGTRSGSVAHDVLGDSKGTLVVDAYTGYNRVTGVTSRTRAGCYAHARRKFYEALAHPEAKEAYDLIGKLYVVEAEVRREGIVGTESHAERRRVQSAPIVDDLFEKARGWRDSHEPRGNIGKAIGYLLDNEASLRVFLGDAAVPIDNNTAERTMRRVALGRGNYLFVGSENGGKSLATLYSVVATCEQHGINPQTYLEAALAETITKDSGADWTPKAWLDRVTSETGADHPPAGNGPPIASNQDA